MDELPEEYAAAIGRARRGGEKPSRIAAWLNWVRRHARDAQRISEIGDLRPREQGPYP